MFKNFVSFVVSVLYYPLAYLNLFSCNEQEMMKT